MVLKNNHYIIVVKGGITTIFVLKKGYRGNRGKRGVATIFPTKLRYKEPPLKKGGSYSSCCWNYQHRGNVVVYYIHYHDIYHDILGKKGWVEASQGCSRVLIAAGTLLNSCGWAEVPLKYRLLHYIAIIMHYQCIQSYNRNAGNPTFAMQETLHSQYIPQCNPNTIPMQRALQSECNKHYIKECTKGAK